MEEKDVKSTGEDLENVSTETEQENTEATGEATDPGQAEIEKLQQEVAELKDKYLRQVAEFDNFRKRTAKERLDLIQTAGKDVIVPLLDVLDDCNRAQQQMDRSDDISAVREGVLLVFNKLRNTLQARGVKSMESISQDFNPDIHEAITEVPAPEEKLKGKVLDEIQKGYYLNDKIIRFAKVVVGK
ncbi:MAG TPA: nucleotide exchange factor GrpE [Chitinophaga sp.]|nr:nucleotide exchange factor GrpE [Chitinophaga sp.]